MSVRGENKSIWTGIRDQNSRSVGGGTLVFVGLAAVMVATVLSARDRLAYIEGLTQGGGHWWQFLLFAAGIALHCLGLVIQGQWAAEGADRQNGEDAKENEKARRQLFDRHLAVLGLYLVSVVFVAAVAVGILVSDGPWFRIVYSRFSSKAPTNSTPAQVSAPETTTNVPHGAMVPIGRGESPESVPAGNASTPMTLAAPSSSTTRPTVQSQNAPTTLPLTPTSTGQTNETAWCVSAQFLMAMGLSWIGSLYFVASRLSEKRESEDKEEFRVAEFWSGLFVYMGEAVLLTMVVFFMLMGQIGFALQGKGNGSETDLTGAVFWLPAVGLIIGMLIKPAETLIFGTASRVLAGIQAALGLSGGAAPAAIAGGSQESLTGWSNSSPMPGAPQTPTPPAHVASTGKSSPVPGTTQESAAPQ
jgi:hypothetical protein